MAQGLAIAALAAAIGIGLILLQAGVSKLRHRILLNFNAEAEGVTSDTVIAKLIQDVPAMKE